MALHIPEKEPPIDPRTQKFTDRWMRVFRAIAGADIAGATGTVWSTLANVTAWRALSEVLSAGMVRQVVVGTTATPVNNDTSTYAATGLSASITPGSATNTVLALVLQNGCRKLTGDTSVLLRLLRGVTALATIAGGAGATGAAGLNDVGTIAGAHLDTPGVTTSVTYSTQFASSANIARASVQANGEQSALVLIEVAA